MPRRSLLAAMILFTNHQVAVQSATVQCPVIECDTTISDFTCYSHSGGMPVEEITTFFCPYDQVCNLEDGHFAWVTSRLQVSDLPTGVKHNSQVYKKYADKSCEPIEEFVQELECGRSCEASRMCKSAFCKPKSQICEGLKEQSSCNAHYQCDVGLGCIMRVDGTKPAWPYWRICDTLRTEGQYCASDQDCELDHYCWYPSKEDVDTDTKKCIKMYSYEIGKVFGYKENDKAVTEKKYKYNLFKNMFMARACKSGMAKIDKITKTMKCVEISHIKTNKDNYGSKQESPYECRLPEDNYDGFKAGGDSWKACKYYYDEGGVEKELETEYCECSLMQETPLSQVKGRLLETGEIAEGETKEEPAEAKKEEQDPGVKPRKNITEGHGHCPFPDQKLLDRYITAYSEILAESSGVLHTNDRYNLKAQFEKLVQEGAVQNETWAEVVQTNFEIYNWPYIQSNQTYTCLNSVLNYSPMNLFKLDAVKVRVAILTSLTTLAIWSW